MPLPLNFDRAVPQQIHVTTTSAVTLVISIINLLFIVLLSECSNAV